MTNLGSGGEAKASPADREAAETDLGQSASTGGRPTGRNPGASDDDETVDQTGRGGTMDTALAIDAAAGATGGITMNEGSVGTAEASLGAGETAAYGETTTNAPAPTAGDRKA